MRQKALSLVLACCLLLSCVGRPSLASRASGGMLASSVAAGDDANLNFLEHTVAQGGMLGSSARVNAQLAPFDQSVPHDDAHDHDDEDEDEDDDAIDDESLLLAGALRDGAAAAAAAATGAEGVARGKGDDDEDEDDPTKDPEFCHRRRYRKRTLKVIKELPFVGLFPELQRTRRFEGSGITFARGSYWVVFDSLRSLGQLDLRFSFRGPENRLVGAVGDESQFEGISYDAETETFIVLRESLATEEHGLVPVTEELRITEDGSGYTVLAVCHVHFALQDVNKGFESLAVFRRGGERYMLGLCESNYCKTIGGPDAPGLRRGNGRLVLAKYVAADDQGNDCSWEVEKVIKLPKDAHLLDYSAIAFRGEFGSDVAVVSQEDAAVWVGSFDWEAMEFVRGEEDRPAGRIYTFPRTADCSKQYCNVEGVAWIDGERLVFASDKSKSTQDYRCMDKDQAVHIMALP